MARKKKDQEDGAIAIEPGTVEYERQQFFEREKAAYEKRTGETVNYVPPHPLTSTPLPEQDGSTDAAESVVEEGTPAEGEG